MTEERRSGRAPGRPSRGSSGPSRSRSGAARTGRSGPSERQVEKRIAQQQALAEQVESRAEEKRRTRLTGRAAILVLVLAVLAVSYASSLRAYLQQRGQIDDLQAQIAEREEAIADLQREKDRWQDEAYVNQQARERFGYVPRGEVPYIVVGADGEPLEATAELTDPTTVGEGDDSSWYGDVWESMKVAGDPPTRIPDPPKEQIGPSQEDLAE